MRARGSLLFLIVAVALPTVGNAQAYRFRTAPPAVTAASAEWQIQGEPIFYAGGFYDPTGPNVFFDGNVMVRTGVYRGVPLYEDATLQPYSVVYVPIAGGLMRPYERRESAPSAVDLERGPAPEYAKPVGTSGAQFVPPQPEAPSAAVPPANMTIESIPAPRDNRGIFLEYAGARWDSAGAAVPFDPNRFRAIGSYHGFTVYAEVNGDPDRIYIPAVPGGALTPYKR